MFISCQGRTFLGLSNKTRKCLTLRVVMPHKDQAATVRFRMTIRSDNNPGHNVDNLVLLIYMPCFIT